MSNIPLVDLNAAGEWRADSDDNLPAVLMLQELDAETGDETGLLLNSALSVMGCN